MQLLKKLMPIAAGIIGGPAVGLAKQAVEGIAQRLGLPKDSDVTAIEAFMRDHPEVHAKMRAADQEFALAMEKQLFEDRESAREKYLKNKDWIAGMTAVAVAFAFVGSIGAMFYMAYNGVEINSGMEMLIGTIIGNITGMMMSKVNFFWGSSKPAVPEKGK